MQNNDQIAERVHKLETKCRRLGLWCVTSTALLVTAGLSAALAPEPQIIKASKFVLLDEDGQPRSAWACTVDGAALVLSSADGRDGVIIGMGSHSLGTVTVSAQTHESGKLKVLDEAFTESGESTSWRGLHAWAHGDARAEISLEHGGSEIVLQTTDGNAAAHLEGDGENFAVAHFGANATHGAGADFSWNDETQVFLEATESEVRLDMTNDCEAWPEVPGGVTLSIQKDKSSLSLRDNDGKVQFEAP